MEKSELSALIRRCQRGDRQARETLILETQDHIYFHCRKMLKNEEDALDATQEILISMLEGLHNLQEPAAFWGWLNQMTANRCKNLLTRGFHENQIPEDEEGNSLLDAYENLDEQTVPDKALDNEETRRMVMELVDALPETQRLCVLMYYYDEMSVKDIAAALETSEGTVKSRLNYARKSIKEGVDRYTDQGIKLYSFSPLPFLLYFLRKDADACCLTHEQSAAIAQKAILTASAARTAASTAAAGTGSKAAASMGTTKVAAAGTAAKAGAGIGTKILAGVLAAAVVTGGVAVGTRKLHQPPAESTASDGTVGQTEATGEMLAEQVAAESERLTASAGRYAAFHDFLADLEQRAGFDDDYGQFLFFDCDEDGEEELLAILTIDGLYLEGYVYDVNDQGEVYAVCSCAGDELTNAGAGILALGRVGDYARHGEESYFAIRYCNGEEGEYFPEDNRYTFDYTYQYTLYAVKDGTLTKIHSLSGIFIDNCREDDSGLWKDCTMDGEPIDGDIFEQLNQSFVMYIDDWGEGASGVSNRENCMEQCAMLSEKQAKPRPVPKTDAAARYAAFYNYLDSLESKAVLLQQPIKEDQSWFLLWDCDGKDALLEFVVAWNAVMQQDVIDLCVKDISEKTGNCITTFYDSPQLYSEDSAVEFGILPYNGQLYWASKNSFVKDEIITHYTLLGLDGSRESSHRLQGIGQVREDGSYKWEQCTLDDAEISGDEFRKFDESFQWIFNSRGEGSSVAPVHRAECMKQCAEQVELLNG